MTIIQLPRGTRFNSNWFRRPEQAGKMIRGVLGLKRLNSAEKKAIAAACDRHNARVRCREEMHPTDFPRYTWEYAQNPVLARRKACLVTYMNEGRILRMWNASIRERERLDREEYELHFPTIREEDQPADGAIYAPSYNLWGDEE